MKQKKYIVMSNVDISKLILLIAQRISDEEKALSEDDPKSTCAANHRGAIRAYRSCLDLINNLDKF